MIQEINIIWGFSLTVLYGKMKAKTACGQGRIYIQRGDNMTDISGLFFDNVILRIRNRDKWKYLLLFLLDIWELLYVLENTHICVYIEREYDF